MIIDSHAHLDDEKFDIDKKDLLNELKKEDYIVINVGCDLQSNINSIKLANENDFIYAAVGMHPHDSRLYDEEFEKILLKQLEEKKVVALGEIGLDYYYDNSKRDIQQEVFIRQLRIAKERNIPFIVHSREASEDTYNILKENYGGNKGVLHSFSGSREMAKKYLDLGLYISFSGTVTFKNASNVKACAKYVPLDKMLIETDSPYLAPVPKRGGRNCPLYVKYIAEQIAVLKGIGIEETINKTTNNTISLFSLR